MYLTGQYYTWNYHDVCGLPRRVLNRAVRPDTITDSVGTVSSLVWEDRILPPKGSDPQGAQVCGPVWKMTRDLFLPFLFQCFEGTPGGRERPTWNRAWHGPD